MGKTLEFRPPPSYQQVQILNFGLFDFWNFPLFRTFLNSHASLSLLVLPFISSLDPWLFGLLVPWFLGSLDHSFVVKLHSDLRILTQFQLVGVGVDFVFPLEGRRKKKKNPHLAFSRWNDPTCLIFSDCLVGVWRVYANCLESVWSV